MTDQTEPLTKERFMQIHGIPQPGALTAERLAEIRAAAIHAVEQHPSTTFMAPCESLADAVLDAVQPALLAEIERLTARVAELEARPDRATVLRAAAADWDRETPDETVTCRDVAAALRLMAAVPTDEDGGAETVTEWGVSIPGRPTVLPAADREDAIAGANHAQQHHPGTQLVRRDIHRGPWRPADGDGAR